MNLRELTNHESGIIVYQSGSVIVVNWGNYDDDQMPVLSPLGLPMQWPQEAGYLDGIVDDEHIDDVRSVIPGRVWPSDEVDGLGNPVYNTDIDIVYDQFNDISRLFLDTSLEPDDLGATVYSLHDGTKIVAPDMWI